MDAEEEEGQSGDDGGEEDQVDSDDGGVGGRVCWLFPASGIRGRDTAFRWRPNGLKGSTICQRWRSIRAPGLRC